MPAGAVDTFHLDSDEVVRNVSKLYMTEPRRFALMAMVHSQGLSYQKEESSVNVAGTPIGVEIVDNPKFEMQLDEIADVKTEATAAAAADATTINVADGTLVPKYALVYVARTGEIFRVTSISTNALTVVRGQSGTSGVAILLGDEMHVLGSAYAENAVSGDITHKRPTFTYNYTQIDREPYGNSRTEQGTKKYGVDNSYDREKRMHLISFLRRWNQRMWLGGRSIDTSTGFRTTGGILESIDSGNVYDVGGNLTRAEFEYWIRKYALAYNSTMKTLFCGSRLIERINSWADDKNILQNQMDISKFGISVRTYHTAWGDLDIVYEPNFDEVTQGSVPLSTYGVALDLPLIKIVYFNNGILKSYDDIQENDRDGRKGEWLMEGGIQINVPKAHAIIRGI